MRVSARTLACVVLLVGLLGSAVGPDPSRRTAFAASPSDVPRVYGLIGQGGLGDPLDAGLLAQQYQAGVRARVVELGWNNLQPNGANDWNTGVAATFQQRIDAFVATGSDTQLYLDLGLTYPPNWVASTDPLIDQYGHTWNGDGGAANMYFSPTVRQYAANYIRQVFTRFDWHGRLKLVRVGFYHAELVFPALGPAAGAPVSFWAFDTTAQARSPVPGWKPGQPSPNNEARKFYLWYVDQLTDAFNFVLGQLRMYYGGAVAPVTPGASQWDPLVGVLVAHNLFVPGWAYVGTGNYWQRIYADLPPASANVVNWVSSVGDASGVDDSSATPWDWSSTHQQAYLAQLSGRQIFGENTGSNAYSASAGADPRSTMQWVFAAMQQYQLSGLLWARQSEMADPHYASLAQYASQIAGNP